jgi:hypothetical protein
LPSLGRGVEDPEGCGDCDCEGSTEKLVDHWRAFSLCVAGPVGLAEAATCPGTCYRRNGLEDAERALTRVSVRLATGEKTEKSYLFVIRFAEEMMLGAPSDGPCEQTSDSCSHHEERKHHEWLELRWVNEEKLNENGNVNHEPDRSFVVIRALAGKVFAICWKEGKIDPRKTQTLRPPQ